MNFRYRHLLFASSSVLLAAGALIACSSDDNVVTLPGDEAGSEAGTEGGRPDTGGQDAGSDVVTKPDADAAPFDAGLTLQNYGPKMAEAICDALSRCCFGNANLDGGAFIDGGDSGTGTYNGPPGTYNRTKCLNDTIYGFETATPQNIGDGGIDPNNLVLDQKTADDCIKKMEAVSCNLGNTEYQALRTLCFAAIVGKRTAGQSCKDSAECQVGLFCNTSLSTPACEAVRPMDGNCGDWTNNPVLAQSSCSYRFSGDTKRFCDFYDLVNEVTRPTNEWKCKAAKGVADTDKVCLNNTWCKDGLCDIENDAFICKTPVNYFPSSYCDNYVE